jgi:hypothetical protein
MNLQHISCHKLIHIAVNVSQNKTVLLRNKKSGHQPHIMEQQVKFYSDFCSYSVLCDRVTSLLLCECQWRICEHVNCVQYWFNPPASAFCTPNGVGEF